MINLNLKSWFVIFTVASITIASCDKDPVENKPTECQNKPTGEIFTEIPNLNFEEWLSGSGAGTVYESPSPKNFWTTPNEGSGDIIFAKVPVVVFKVGKDSAHSGNYAAMLKTGEGKLGSKNTIVAATIASGDFKPNAQNPLNSLKFGKRFEKRPKTVSGYYKYFPIASDSASAYCFVTKLDANCKVDTIGIGRKLFYELQDSYAKFEFDIEYKNNETPENIVIYFSSSEAGDEFKGQVGNTLFIDDVTVTYHD